MPRAQLRTFIYLTFLAAALLSGCSKKGEAGAPDAGANGGGMPVKFSTVQLRQVADYTEFLGTLRSRNSAVLQPQVEGQIVKIFVSSGAHVAPGQPILEIDPLKQQATVTNLEASRRSRQANLGLARTELARRKQLYAAGVISKADLDQAQTAFDAASADVEAQEAGIREQQVQLHYYTVKAPSAGTIGDIPVRVGDRVTVQTVLTTLDQGGELEAYISIPSENASRVRLGTPVEILGEDNQPSVRSKVTFISPRVDPDTQLLLIKAAVPNSDLRFRNEQVVHTRVIWAENQRPTVPMTAVSRINGQTFVFVMDETGGKTVARQKQVQLGDITGADYVVLNGIGAGEKIITTGIEMLADGMSVKPIA